MHFQGQVSTRFDAPEQPAPAGWVAGVRLGLRLSVDMSFRF
jgi:hypothetical protein